MNSNLNSPVGPEVTSLIEEWAESDFSPSFLEDIPDNDDGIAAIDEGRHAQVSLAEDYIEEYGVDAFASFVKTHGLTYAIESRQAT